MAGGIWRFYVCALTGRSGLQLHFEPGATSSQEIVQRRISGNASEVSNRAQARIFI
jgi:hypothetical protein